MDVWDNGIQHSSPIRIERVTPLGTGKSELELTFFHACYPEGVQNKVYRLRVLHRSERDIVAVRIDVDGHPTVRLTPLTRQWLARQEGVPALVAMAAADGDDFAGRLNRLTGNDEAPDPLIPFHLSWEIEETVMNCALRFDGYAWLEGDKPHREAEVLAAANENLLRDLTLDAGLEVNFASFFFLQRFLGKWGGEMLPRSDRHHTAYRFLFLHLHSHPTPERWIHREYEARWQNTPTERVVQHAATVRRMLLTATLRSGLG
jgi:hypothetical protein